MRYCRSASTLFLAAVVVTACAAEASATPGRGRHHPASGPAVGFYGSLLWPGWGLHTPFGPYAAWWASPLLYAPPVGERVGLRIEVEPPETEVYVDGYLAGVVDLFDGLFQRLHVAPGPHVIELYLDGHEPVREQLYASAGTSYKIRHEMLPLGAGETAPPRPRPREPEPVPPVSMEHTPDDTYPAASRSVGFGTLTLRVQPSPTEIRIDGEAWPGGVSGELTVHLPAGRHHVEIRRSDHAVFETEVDVAAGEATPLNVKLPPSR